MRGGSERGRDFSRNSIASQRLQGCTSKFVGKYVFLYMGDG